jgi:hypothetical protein
VGGGRKGGRGREGGGRGDDDYAKTAMRLSGWVETLGPKKHHVENMRNSLAANERYCSKEREL